MQRGARQGCIEFNVLEFGRPLDAKLFRYLAFFPSGAVVFVFFCVAEVDPSMVRSCFVSLRTHALIASLRTIVSVAV